MYYTILHKVKAMYTKLCTKALKLCLCAWMSCSSILSLDRVITSYTYIDSKPSKPMSCSQERNFVYQITKLNFRH